MKKSSSPLRQPFMYEDFSQALNALHTAFSASSAYALLLGESGSGKTTLLRTLADKLDHHRFHVLYLCHRSPCGLSRMLAEALHLPLNLSRTQISRLLLQSLRNLPTRLLLYIDEAQLIDEHTLQDIRLLAESDLHSPPLFSVLLTALPQFKEILLSPQLFPLWRRISPKLTLTGLRKEELIPFLSHAVEKNINTRFSEPALAAIFEQGRGLPALIQSFAMECLHAHPKGQIDAEQVADVLQAIETN